MAPAHHAAVREAFDVLYFSAAGTGDGMRQIGRAASAARHVAPIDSIGITPLYEFGHFRNVEQLAGASDGDRTRDYRRHRPVLYH